MTPTSFWLIMSPWRRYMWIHIDQCKSALAAYLYVAMPRRNFHISNRNSIDFIFFSLFFWWNQIKISVGSHCQQTVRVPKQVCHCPFFPDLNYSELDIALNKCVNALGSLAALVYCNLNNPSNPLFNSWIQSFFFSPVFNIIFITSP